MTDLQIAFQRAEKHRQRAFRLDRKDWLKSKQEAVDFVNERGFVFFWPIKNINLPSLWKATVGDRPVPNNHDDPGHITWRWKDELLDKRVWYYAKLILKKSTILSFKLAPYFYTLTPNYGDYENDYLVRYKNGLMTVEMKNVYEALLRYGAIHTLELRQKARMTSTDSKYRFDKALSDLQADMMIQPTGTAKAGRWGYAMVYDITARYHPEIVEQARFLTEQDAQKTLILTHIHAVGLVEQKELSRIFRWDKEHIQKACEKLVEEGSIQIVEDPENNSPIYALPSIFHLQ